MKLPNRTTTAVQPSTPSITPGQIAAAQQSEMGAVNSLVNTSLDTYKAVAVTAVNHAETRAAREYAEQWGAVQGKEFISTEELDNVGVDYDPNLAEQQTTTGPGGEQVTQAVLPTWAVSEAYHKRIVGGIRDKHTPTVNDAARQRFLADYDTKYAAQAQANVSIAANEQRVAHQRGALDRDVQDLAELGDYGHATTLINRAKAAGLLSDEQYHNRVDAIHELKEVSGYEDVIVNGDLAAQQRLYDELSEGMKPDSKRYNGELTVPERRPYLSRLATNLKAARERTSQENTAGYYLDMLRTASDNGNTLDPKTLRHAVGVVRTEGTATQQLRLNNEVTRLADTEVIYSLPSAVTPDAVAAAAAASGASAEAVFRADNIRKAAEQKHKQYNQDPITFGLSYGPNTPLQKAAKTPVDVRHLLASRPAEVAKTLNARVAYNRELSGYYGPTVNVLTSGELESFRSAYNSGGVAQKLTLVETLASLEPGTSKAVFDQLAASGTVEGYAMPAAAAALNAGAFDGATMILQSADAMKDPEVKSYANNAELRRAVYDTLPPGLELSVGSQGRLQFAKALTNLYAYQAAQQGVDPKTLDTELLDKSMTLISGGNLTDYGRTRVRPPRGQTAEGLNSLLRRGSADFWQEKLDEGEYRFSRTGANVTGEGLRQQLAKGNAWLAAAQDGSDGYLVMTYLSEPGSADYQPTIARDATGAPLTLRFDDSDFKDGR